jgi:hypothetical protein
MIEWTLLALVVVLFVLNGRLFRHVWILQRQLKRDNDALTLHCKAIRDLNQAHTRYAAAEYVRDLEARVADHADRFLGMARQAVPDLEDEDEDEEA